MKKSNDLMLEQVTEMALAFPGVEQGASYGTPSLRVRKEFMARLREQYVMVLTPVEDIEKQFLMETQPETYFITDHYRGYLAILIRLSKAHPQHMRELIEQSWRRLAPKKLIEMHDGATESPAPSRKRSADKLTG